MKSLEPPDSLHLRAAQSWLELGDHLEANGRVGKNFSAVEKAPRRLALALRDFCESQAAFLVAVDCRYLKSAGS